MPGVEAVGGVSFLPLTGYNPGAELTIEGRPTEAGDVVPRVDYQRITPDYFRAMRIPLLSGRSFGAADMRPGPETVIINDALARRFWPGEDALGKRIRLPKDGGATGILTIVGVVGNLRPFGPQAKSQPELYLPLYRPTMTLVIRTPGNPAHLVPAVRDVARSLSRNRAAFTLRTMPQMMIDLAERRRVFGWLLAGMATVGLTLTALGIYGVISHQTARRTGEMGVRLALGAQARDVLGLVIREAMTLALGGVAVGLVGAGAMMRILRSLPFGVSPADPLTLASVALVAGGVALLASYLPARRAAKVDPMEALRCE